MAGAEACPCRRHVVVDLPHGVLVIDVQAGAVEGVQAQGLRHAGAQPGVGRRAEAILAESGVRGAEGAALAVGLGLCPGGARRAGDRLVVALRYVCGALEAYGEEQRKGN